jgi:hypothetical protein
MPHPKHPYPQYLRRHLQHHLSRSSLISLSAVAIITLWLVTAYQAGQRFLVLHRAHPKQVPVVFSVTLEAIFGFLELASDGGPEFTASLTREFLTCWGMGHRLSSAHHPQSNGTAEVDVKSLKRLLRSDHQDP